MTFLIGLGSNIDQEKNIPEALRKLSGFVRLTGISPFFRTSPLEGRDQPDYCNGLVMAETDTGLTGEELIKALKMIEDQLGRVRDPKDKYASRTIDLDLLAVDNVIRDADDFLKRPFNLATAAVLCPELIIDDKRNNRKTTAVSLYKAMPESNGIVAMPDFDNRIEKEFLHE